MNDGSAQAQGATILVVDDNEANRRLAENTLEDEGYRVVLASAGLEALDLFAKELPACVLLDVRMPGLDGFAVCERLRQLPGGAETPVLFLTALRDVDTFDRALHVGSDDFLTKPIRPTELVLRVEAALKLRQMRIEIREHYELLKRQRDDLMRLQLQKERLMAFLVHDLKNPVSAMDLHAQVLARDPSLSADARASAGEIRTEARHLTRMIMNLLDISKADEGQLSPQRTSVDVGALFDELRGELEVVAKEKGVTLTCSASIPAFEADRDLVQRMLTNFIENAVRHAPARSIVSCAAVEADGFVELRVDDAGPGVPPELREKIFEPFVQLEADGGAQTSRTGRGLGLAFCRVVALAHGGSIGIDDLAPGSSFWVRLPR